MCYLFFQNTKHEEGLGNNDNKSHKEFNESGKAVDKRKLFRQNNNSLNNWCTETNSIRML